MTTYCNGVVSLQQFAEIASHMQKTFSNPRRFFTARSAVNTEAINCKIALFRVSGTAIWKADLGKAKRIAKRKNKRLG